MLLIVPLGRKDVTQNKFVVTVISFSNEEVCPSESHLREEDLTQDSIFSFAMKMCVLQCPTLGEEDLIQTNKD